MFRLLIKDFLQPETAPKQILDSPMAMQDVFEIRRRVFVVEQNVAAEEEFEYEEQSNHALVIMGGQGMGCGRWRRTDYGFKIERMAVLESFRGKGVGALVINTLLKDLPEANHLPVYLHAQTHAVSFYERHGFQSEGALFYECEIPHFKMVLKR
jgi:predicted GNAT family N-acyltransferase